MLSGTERQVTAPCVSGLPPSGLDSAAHGRHVPPMKRCSQCAELVQNDALVCRHCQHRFTAEETAAAASKRRGGKVMGAVLLVVVLIAVGRWLGDDANMNYLADVAVAAES